MKATIACLLFLLLALPRPWADRQPLAQERWERGVVRISAGEARERVLAGEALLVCAYDDERCSDLLLEGAMLRGELEGSIEDLPKDKSIIFY